MDETWSMMHVEVHYGGK